MTTQQKISAILGQENYKVSDGKVLRYDQLDDKFKPVIVSGNRIPLVKTGQIVEIFAWDDVKSVIDGMGGAAWTLDGRELSEKIIGTVDVLDFPIHTKNKLVFKKHSKNKSKGSNTALSNKIDWNATSDVVDGVRAAKLPDDYMSYDKIGVIKSDGKIEKLKPYQTTNSDGSMKKIQQVWKEMGVTSDVPDLPFHTKNKLIGKIDLPISEKDKSDLLVKINKSKNVKEVKKVINKTKKQIMAKKKKAETKTKSNRKPSVNLTDEHIAIIKKEHNKGTSKMAIARLLSEKTGMDVTRFIVMYHVKKIDAKKK